MPILAHPLCRQTQHTCVGAQCTATAGAVSAACRISQDAPTTTVRSGGTVPWGAACRSDNATATSGCPRAHVATCRARPNSTPTLLGAAEMRQTPLGLPPNRAACAGGLHVFDADGIDWELPRVCSSMMTVAVQHTRAPNNTVDLAATRYSAAAIYKTVDRQHQCDIWPRGAHACVSGKVRQPHVVPVDWLFVAS